MFLDLVDRKLAISDYKNIDLKTRKYLIFPFFLVENKKFGLFFFFSKIGEKVFCVLLDRKLAILDYKNIDLKESKILHFSKGVISQWFFVKNWNFCRFSFFSKIGHKKVFCGHR